MVGHQVSWIVPVLGLAVVAAAIPYIAGIGAARALGAKLASFIGLAEVLFAVLFAWLLLGQLPTIMQFFGGASILAGVTLVRIDELKEPSAPVRPEHSWAHCSGGSSWPARAPGGTGHRARDPVKHGPDREPVRPKLGIVELVPVDRRRHRRAGRRPRAVRRDQRLVVHVLGVVEPRQAVAVADVPLPAHQLGHDRADRLG